MPEYNLRGFDPQEKIDQVNRWFTTAFLYRSDMTAKWQEGDRRFARDETVIKWGSGRSRIYVPLIYTKVRVLKDNIIEALWGANEDFFDIQPVEPLDTIPAMALKKVDRIWLKQCKALRELEDAIHQHILLGTGVVTLHWDAEKHCPIVKWRDLLTVYPEPNATSVEMAEYIIIRNVVPKHILRRLRERGVYSFSDEALEAGIPIMAESGEITPEAQRRAYLGETGSAPTGWQSFAEVLEVYEDDVTTFILNRREVIAVDNHKWGMKPIIMTQFIRKQTGIWGDGLWTILKPEEDRQITIDNMLMDNLALQTYRMFLVRKGAIAREDIEIRPEGIIQVMSGRGSLADRPLSDLIQPLLVQDIGQAGMALRTTSTRVADDASGVYPMIQGVSAAGVDTATEFSGLIRQGAIGVKSYLRTLEMGLIEPMIQWIHRLARSNAYSATQAIRRILGDRFMGQNVNDEFARAVLEESDDWDVVIKTGSRYVNEQMLQRNMLLLAQVALQSPYTNVPYFLEKLFQIYGFNDAAVLVTVPAGQEQGQGAGVSQAQSGGQTGGIVPPEKLPPEEEGALLKQNSVIEAPLMGAIER